MGFADRLAGRFAGRVAGRVASRLAGRVASRLAGRFAYRLGGRLGGRLIGNINIRRGSTQTYKPEPSLISGISLIIYTIYPFLAPYPNRPLANYRRLLTP